jgi:UPF0716 family protein affecting phage T7 exclusion
MENHEVGERGTSRPAAVTEQERSSAGSPKLARGMMLAVATVLVGLAAVLLAMFGVVWALLGLALCVPLAVAASRALKKGTPAMMPGE